MNSIVSESGDYATISDSILLQSGENIYIDKNPILFSPNL